MSKFHNKCTFRAAVFAIATSCFAGMVSPASACMGPSGEENYFFPPNQIPEVNGIVAVEIEVVDKTKYPDWVVTNPDSNASKRYDSTNVIAKVGRVVKGSVSSDHLTLMTSGSSCSHVPPVGSKGIVVGRLEADGSQGVAIHALSWTQSGRYYSEKEEAKSCSLPSKPFGASVVVFGTSFAETLSSVSIAGSDRDTRVVRVVVDKGLFPIYAVLGNDAPTIWKFEGDVDRVKQVVLSSHSGTTSMYNNAAVGIPKDRVTFSTCLPVAHEFSQDQDLLRRILRREVSSVDVLNAKRKTYAVRLPSLETIDADINISRLSLPSGIDDRTAQRVLDSAPGGLAEINSNDVVWVSTPTKYQIQPGEYGIASLIGQKALTEIVDLPVALKHEREKKRLFKIEKEIEGLPFDHSRLVVYLLGKDVPQPKNTANACIYREDDGQRIVSEKSAGCSPRNLNGDVAQAAPPPRMNSSQRPFIGMKYGKGPSIQSFMMFPLTLVGLEGYRVSSANDWTPQFDVPMLVNSDNGSDDYLFVVTSENYDSFDFIPIAPWARQSMLLLAGPKLPSVVTELIAYGKKAGKLRYAYIDSALATSIRVRSVFDDNPPISNYPKRVPSDRGMAERFGKASGISMTGVAFGSKDELFAGIARGQADIVFTSEIESREIVDAGLVKAVGHTGAAPIARRPNVPAIADTVPGYVDEFWVALGARPGTDADLVRTLRRQVLEVRDNEKTKSHVVSAGGYIDPMNTDAFVSMIERRQSDLKALLPPPPPRPAYVVDAFRTCGFKVPTDDVQVVVVAPDDYGSSDRSRSMVAFGDDNRPVEVQPIVVGKGVEKLSIVIMNNNRRIYQISGSVDRVEKVSVAGFGRNKNAAGVSGILKEKVEFGSSNDCLGDYWKWFPRDEKTKTDGHTPVKLYVNGGIIVNRLGVPYTNRRAKGAFSGL